MTTKRLLILQIVLLAGLSTIWILPKAKSGLAQGVELALPDFIGEWYGKDQQISERELEVLAADTEFARKLYTNGRGDQIFVSIVMSGHDLDNSIHRPERCLPAQGWSIADSSTVSLRVPALPEKLTLTRLHNVRAIPLDNGETMNLYNLNYYFFIGADNLTHSHFARTFIDIRDRIVKGQNQRWAYVTIASNITKDLSKFGRTEQETDEMVRKFIGEIFPVIYRHDPVTLTAANAGS